MVSKRCMALLLLWSYTTIAVQTFSVWLQLPRNPLNIWNYWICEQTKHLFVAASNPHKPNFSVFTLSTFLKKESLRNLQMLHIILKCTCMKGIIRQFLKLSDRHLEERRCVWQYNHLNSRQTHTNRRVPLEALPGGSKAYIFADFRVCVMHVCLHVWPICPTENAPWYESSNGRLMLMTLAAAVSLLVFILSMSVFLCHRTRQAKTSKGPM